MTQLRLNMLTHFLLAIIHKFLLIKLANGVVVEESNTGALLSFPFKYDGDELFNATWEVAPAQFGFHDYGGSLTGYLVLPANVSYSTACTEEPSGLNQYIHFLEDWTGDNEDLVFFLLIDRGDCYFTTKVENAEKLGAAAAIVLDSQQESEFTMWPPEDWSDDINIPSVLLDEVDSARLMGVLGVTSWNALNVSYPDAYDITWTIAKLEWGLPHDDDRVEWELWTSSNDDASMEFKKNFKSTQLSLAVLNDTIFTPYYYILNGTHWSCDDGQFRCKGQCTNSGRYCYVDPDNDLYRGLNGFDVIQENLRQICIWNYSKTYHNEQVWWEYAIAWDTYCFNGTEQEDLFTENCSRTQIDSISRLLSLTVNLSEFVTTCISQSGGYGYYDGVNTLLENQVSIRETDGIYTLPTIIVNEFTVYGNIDCEVITTSDCEVLNAICAGFLNGTEPNVCYACADADKDCSGTCYGTKVNDSCGQCLYKTNVTYNYCVGCDGVAWSNKTYDCANTCGGIKQFNDCGYCINKTLTNFDVYGQDCKGECGGSYQNDSCGQCLLTSDTKWNSCVGCDNVAHSNKTKDCAGVCGGNKRYNDCGYCLNSTATNFDTYGTDCNGDCNGKYEDDDCGNCLLSSDPTWNSCVGCDNVPNSSKTNDCQGVCGGNATYTSCGFCIDKNDPTFYTICGDSDTDKSIKTSLTIVIAISTLSILLIIIAGVVVYRLWKRSEEHQKRYSEIVKQYSLMDEGPVQTGKKKKGGHTQVPDHELDIEYDEN